MSKVYISMYHYVRDLKNSRYSEIKGLDYELFSEQIKWMKNNFTIIRMEELIAAYNHQIELPEKSMLLTFDDGYMDNYTNVLPILDRENVQGSFFISGKTFVESKLLDVNKIHFILASAGTQQLVKDVCEQMDYYRGEEFDFASNQDLYEQYAHPNRFDNGDVIFAKRMLQTALPERLRNMIAEKLFLKYVGIPEDKFAKELYMNSEQIRFMKKSGMYIGVHGYDHYWLGDLPQDKMQADIEKGLEVMDEFIDSQNWVMNYPYGNCNDGVIKYISNRGCSLGITVEAEIADTIYGDRYKVPRLDTNDFPPKSEEYRKISL